jgi:NAD(P)-dependent dehydrogenase (short-subunit alcohol dehydrogenase family)
MTGVLLITGGASGIGAETARRAAKQGYKVAINYRTRDAQAMGLAADIAAQNGEAIAVPADMAPKTIERLLAVNVTGLMLCCREAAKRMSTRHGGKGGAIVNVSSMAATLGGRPGASAYAATKGAVDAFTKAFAREVAAEGIRVNSIRPGLIETEMTEKRLKDQTFRSYIEASIPMRRVGQAPEVADAILWLLSDQASFISGAMLDAAGGGYNL